MNLKAQYLKNLQSFLHLKMKKSAKSLLNTSELKKMKKLLIDDKLKIGVSR